MAFLEEHRTFLFALLIPVLYLIFAIGRQSLHHLKLGKIPGPTFAGWSTLWLVRVYASTNSREVFMDVNRKYGKLARIGPNHVLTDDPDFTWKILGVHSNYRRGTWFDSLRFDPHYTSIASETDVAKHDNLRSRVAAGYAMRSPTLEPEIDTQITAWVEQLRGKIGQEKEPSSSLDLAKSIRSMALNVAGYICFSQSLDLKDDDPETEDFWASMEENAPYAQYLSAVRGLFLLTYYLTMIPSIKSKMLLTEHNNPGIGRILKYSRIATEKRFEPGAKPINDMMGSWVKNGLSPHELETEVSIALVTGAFPVAAAINVIVLHIISNPRILSKVREELDHNDRLSSSSLQVSQFFHFPYLQACIDESLRLFPPITQLRERVVPPQGDEFAGYYLPGGTNIGLNTQGLTRHSCFGSDPDVFRPERWLSASPDSLAMMRKVQMLIFGHGSTRCLGINQAMMVITKAVAALLCSFDIEISNPSKPWIDQSSGVSFHRDFFVELSER